MKASTKIKLMWKTNGKGLTLKQYSRDLASSEKDEDKELSSCWWSNKHQTPQKEQKAARKKNKGALLAEIRSKSKVK